jgi:Flp pilus assembly protein TadB
MFCSCILPFMAFGAVWAANFPKLLPPIFAAVLVYGLSKYSVHAIKKERAAQFRGSAYKIYRYLHNQVASGIKTTDAIKTVYRVVDDKELKQSLMLLAARYTRTLDIEASLEQFRKSYDMQEVESLCVALKQGIDTGDNKETLRRKERVMFRRHFNFVQAETDMCRLKSKLVVCMFIAIIIIMLVIPLLNDINDAGGRIFIN